VFKEAAIKNERLFFQNVFEKQNRPKKRVFRPDVKKIALLKYSLFS